MPKEEKPNARCFGVAVRAALEELGLDVKVKVRTVGFSGFGYGDGVFADISAGNIHLTEHQSSQLRAVVKRFAGMPADERLKEKLKFGIMLSGSAYPMGGSIK